MGSPISLGTVSPFKYDDKDVKTLRFEAFEMAQRIEGSPWYICGLQSRENLICVHAHLTAVLEILEYEAAMQEAAAKPEPKEYYDFEGQR